jgi:soluble lytic murein transglycosylase-like protein
MALPAAALAAGSGSPSIGVSAAKPIRIGAIAPPVARFQRTIRVVSRRMRAERRAELRLRGRRRLFTGLPAGVSQATLDAIGACESGGDPAAVSADGTYRGKYQFDYGTWESVGGSGDPAAASEAEQDYRAALLYAQAGSSPWPICG